MDLEALNDLPDALFVVEDGRVVWASSGAGALLSALRDELIGRPIQQLVAPGEIDRLQTLDAQRKLGWSIPETSRVRFIRPCDGAAVAADVRFVIDDDAGKMLLSARNAAELIRAEELADVLMRLSGGQVEADEYLDACGEWFKKRGWTLAVAEVGTGGTYTRKVLTNQSDPIGEYAQSLIGRWMPLASTPILAQVIESGRPLFLDNVPTMMTGAVKRAVVLAEAMAQARVARSAWCPVIRDGRVTHVIAAAGSDLSEYDFIVLQSFATRLGAVMRKTELREELVHRERLAALGEMAAVLAHEIRNPLAVIFNTVSTFRRQVVGPNQSELLEILSDEARHLERLTSDLLAWARPAAAAAEPSELAPIVKESVQAARHEPDLLQGVSIEVELGEELPLAIVDPPLLHRALVNLLTNALQHVSNGGRVRVRGKLENDAIVVSVENDGPPISPEDARRIFDPFFTKRPRGTGLGLCVVKQLVESMGGTIELESTREPVRFALRLRCEP